MSRRRKKSSQEALREALLLLAPGTVLREALSAILQAGTGSLICLGDPRRLSALSEGGFQMDAPVTPQLVYELSKMDGATILNADGTRVLFANRFLKPTAKIPSDETGTRHRTAQRFAAQGKCIVIAVSQRRSSVTLYVNDIRHTLDSIQALVNKTIQAINTLEKYMSVLVQAMQELTVREFQDVVTIFDVCRAVQRTEMVLRIAREIEPRILELGTEGRLLDLQLKELMLPAREAQLVVRDYFIERSGVTPETIHEKIKLIPQDELLNLGSISQALGYGVKLRSVDTYLTPRGYRVLTLTQRLSTPLIESLVQRFGNLQHIMRAPKEDLTQVEGVGDVLAERIRTSLQLLRNQLTLQERK